MKRNLKSTKKQKRAKVSKSKLKKKKKQSRTKKIDARKAKQLQLEDCLELIEDQMTEEEAAQIKFQQKKATLEQELIRAPDYLQMMTQLCSNPKEFQFPPWILEEQCSKQLQLTKLLFSKLFMKFEKEVAVQGVREILAMSQEEFLNLFKTCYPNLSKRTDECRKNVMSSFLNWAVNQLWEIQKPLGSERTCKELKRLYMIRHYLDLGREENKGKAQKITNCHKFVFSDKKANIAYLEYILTVSQEFRPLLLNFFEQYLEFKKSKREDGIVVILYGLLFPDSEKSKQEKNWRGLKETDIEQIGEYIHTAKRFKNVWTDSMLQSALMHVQTKFWTILNKLVKKEDDKIIECMGLLKEQVNYGFEKVCKTNSKEENFFGGLLEALEELREQFRFELKSPEWLGYLMNQDYKNVTCLEEVRKLAKIILVKLEILFYFSSSKDSITEEVFLKLFGEVNIAIIKICGKKLITKKKLTEQKLMTLSCLEKVLYFKEELSRVLNKLLKRMSSSNPIAESERIGNFKRVEATSNRLID
jgi:hypothetical protein